MLMDVNWTYPAIYCILQYIQILNHSTVPLRTNAMLYISCLVAKSSLTLCNPMDYSPLGSSVHGILQARVLEWFAISSSRGSSQPRDQTHVFCVFCIFRQVLYHWATWEAHNLVRPQQIFKFIILQDWEQKPFILIFWGSGYECTFLKLEIFYCKIIQIDLKRTDSHRSCFRLYWLQPHMSKDRYRWTFFM